MLQKKYKESGKAKIKKTPTLAELKLAKQKRKIQEEEQLIPPVPVSAPSSIPAHRYSFISSQVSKPQTNTIL